MEISLSVNLMQLTAVHLVDAHLCSDPGKYVSALLLSLSTMLHLELPHVNVLSKIDMIESYGTLGSISCHSTLLLSENFKCSAFLVFHKMDVPYYRF